MEPAGPIIEEPYLLTIRIPLGRDADGSYWAGELWAKDLLLHFDYIRDLHICCPVIRRNETHTFQIPQLSDQSVVALRKDGNILSVLRNLIPNFLALHRAMKGREIVHSDGGGWAFPLSYYILLHPRRSRPRTWLIVIESSFWRLPDGASGTFRQRIASRFHTAMLSRCVRAADLTIFTHQWYRDLLLGEDKTTSLVAPAIWINADHIRPALDGEDRALLNSTPTKILFPSRLIPEKGVHDLLAAIEQLRRMNREDQPLLEIDIMGDGPLRELCQQAADAENAADQESRIRLRVLDSVPYGQPFFDQVRRHHAVLICNRTAEQPRVIYDVYSQGRAVIGARTPGTVDLLDPVAPNLTFASGKPEALAALLKNICANPSSLETAAEKAIIHVQGRSHERVHRERAEFMTRHLPYQDGQSGKSAAIN